MAENETPVISGTPAGQTETPAEPSTPAPLTVEAIREALLPEVRREMKAAYDAARRAEAKAERAPEKFREFMAPIEEAVESLLTRDMTDDARDAFRAKRDLARATRTDPEAEQQRHISEFQAEAASILEEEGIKADDPILVAAYQKYVAGAKSPAQWRTALGRSIGAVHKERAAGNEKSVTDREKKAREDERNKILNEKREKDGPIDKGQPASSAKKNVMDMSDDEWRTYEAARDAERKAQRIGRR